MQFLYTRQYKVDIDTKLFDQVQEYDELYETSYAFQLIDAATRCNDAGDNEGTLYLQLDDDGSGCYSWFDEEDANKETLFTVRYDSEEHDADYDTLAD